MSNPPVAGDLPYLTPKRAKSVRPGDPAQGELAGGGRRYVFVLAPIDESRRPERAHIPKEIPLASDVTTLLAAAKTAVAHVKTTVPFGAPNRSADYAESYEKNRKAIEGNDPNVVDKVLGAMTYFLPLLTGANRAMQIGDVLSGNAAPGMLARLRQISQFTMRTKAGNCNKQSITAFVYLYDHNVRPLAWMHLTNGKHAFVVLGRKAKSGDDPAKWGDTAVVCDPWNNEGYALPAVQGQSILQAKWGCGTSTAIFGVE